MESTILLSSVIAYMVVLVVVGIYSSKKVHNADDFMVAGRSLGVFVLVGTLLATWMGSGSLIGAAGLAYSKGFSAIWFSAGVWIAACIVFLFADRVRRFAMYTVPDILETRYNSLARILGTLVTVIAYTVVVSYQFRAGGIVLEYVTGINQEIGYLITFLFVVFFTALAGLRSVATIDVINGVVMVVGIFIAIPFAFFKVGGVAGLQTSLPGEHLSLMGDMTFLKAFSYSLPTMLLFLGESNMFQRFFSARDEFTAKKAVTYWIVGTIIMELSIDFLAICGRALYPELEHAEHILIHIARNGLPLFLGCILLSAAISMIVSTADSFLLTPVNNLVHDIYNRYINPNASTTHLLKLSRIVTLLLGTFAFIQLRYFDSVMEMALYAYTMYGVGITPATLAAFFWKRATTAGGVSSIAAGMIVTLIWELGKPQELLRASAGLFGESGTLWPLVNNTVYPAVIASLICLIGVSLLTPKPHPSQWQPFFKKGKDDQASDEREGRESLATS